MTEFENGYSQNNIPTPPIGQPTQPNAPWPQAQYGYVAAPNVNNGNMQPSVPIQGRPEISPQYPQMTGGPMTTGPAVANNAVNGYTGPVQNGPYVPNGNYQSVPAPATVPYPPIQNGTPSGNIPTPPVMEPSSSDGVHEDDDNDDGITSGTGPDDGLRSRLDIARRMDSTGDGSGWRPFWEYRQEHLDESAITWNVEKNLDGSMRCLYIETPFGYQDDVYGAKESIVLNSVADSMEEQGHKDWADMLRADRMASSTWRTGASQSFGFSFVPGVRPDTTRLMAMATDDPYGISQFNKEYMDKPAPDEEMPKGAERGFIAWGNALIGITGMLAILSIGAAPVMMAGAAATALTAFGCYSIGFGLRGKRISAPLERPGFILETTEGWLVWQYDSSFTSTPKKLAEAAGAQLDAWISQAHSNDTDLPYAVSASASADGRMVWFKSNRKLPAKCDLTPYQAEQYLSMYVKHQSGQVPTRTYPGNEPTVIMGTVAEGMDESVRIEERRSAWSAVDAVKRAEERINERKALPDDDPSNEVLNRLSELENSMSELFSNAMGNQGQETVEAMSLVNRIKSELNDMDLPHATPDQLIEAEDRLSRMESEVNKASEAVANASAMKTMLTLQTPVPAGGTMTAPPAKKHHDRDESPLSEVSFPSVTPVDRRAVASDDIKGTASDNATSESNESSVTDTDDSASIGIGGNASIKDMMPDTDESNADGQSELTGDDAKTDKDGRHVVTIRLVDGKNVVWVHYSYAGDTIHLRRPSDDDAENRTFIGYTDGHTVYHVSAGYDSFIVPNHDTVLSAVWNDTVIPDDDEPEKQADDYEQQEQPHHTNPFLS